MNIKFEGSLTKEEFESTVKLANRPILKSNTVHIEFWVSLVTIGLILAAIGLRLLFVNANMATGVIVLVASALFFVFGMRTRGSIGRAWNEYQITDMSRAGVITDDYIEIRNSISSSQTLWNGFSGYGEFRDGIALFQNSVVHSFPSRFFQSEADWQEFNALIAKKLPMTHKFQLGQAKMSYRVIILLFLLSATLTFLIRFFQDTR